MSDAGTDEAAQRDAKPGGGLRRGLVIAARNPLTAVGALICLAMLVAAVFGPWIAPFPEDGGIVVKFQQRLQPPSVSHWFGTDLVGRDALIDR